MRGLKTGGRQKGVPNKATAEIKALARAYAPEIVAELARLALNAESEQARVAAGRELLDRGFGRPSQIIGADEDTGPVIITWGDSRS